MASRTEAPASGRLARFLSHARRRLAMRRGFEAALRSLPWSLGASALVVLALRLGSARQELALEPRAPLAIAGLLVALAALGAGVAAALRRFAPEEIALLVDRALDTRERLATATWSRGGDEAERRAAEALEALGARSAAEALPLRPPAWRGGAGGVAALGLALLLPLPGPPEPPPAPEADPEVQAAAQQVEERVEELAEELEERSPPESVERLLEEVGRTAASLQQEPATREEAELALQKLEQRVQRERDEREAADAGALERALSAMEQATLTRRAARAAQRGDLEALERELASLAEAFREGVSFERRDLDRMSVRLEEAAAELAESSHSELAQQLAEIAKAMQEGDLERAAELLEQLERSGALDRAADDVAAGLALEQTQAMLQQALAQLGRARPDQLGPSAAQEAAELLREAAGALAEAGAEAPAGRLEEIADELDGGDVQSAMEAAEEMLAEGVLREPAGSPEGDAAAREAERLLASALAAMREAQSGGGEGQWRGPRGRTGLPSIPEDWGVGSTNEAAAAFPSPPGGNQSDRQSDETSEWIEAYEALYESSRLEDTKGRSTRVRGEVGEGEHVAVPVWSTAPGPGQAQRPPVALPPSYARASEEALAQETIPAGYAESVRRYFESLGEPAAPRPDETKGEPE